MTSEVGVGAGAGVGPSGPSGPSGPPCYLGDPFGDHLIGHFEKAVADWRRGVQPAVAALLSKHGSHLRTALLPLGTVWLPSGHQVAMALRTCGTILQRDVDVVADQRSRAVQMCRYPAGTTVSDPGPPPSQFAFMAADSSSADVVVTLRTDTMETEACWTFNFMYMYPRKARPKWPRQARLEDPKGTALTGAAKAGRLPPPSAAAAAEEDVSEGTQLRCNMRVVYDPSVRTFSFARDAEMRDPAQAAAVFDMEALPAHVPTTYGTMQDAVYVFLAYVVGEPRSDSAPHNGRKAIRQITEPLHARRMRRIPSCESQRKKLEKEIAEAKKWRKAKGLDPSDSDYDGDE